MRIYALPAAKTGSRRLWKKVKVGHCWRITSSVRGVYINERVLWCCSCSSSICHRSSRRIVMWILRIYVSLSGIWKWKLLLLVISISGTEREKERRYSMRKWTMTYRITSIFGVMYEVITRRFFFFVKKPGDWDWLGEGWNILLAYGNGSGYEYLNSIYRRDGEGLKF